MQAAAEARVHQAVAALLRNAPRDAVAAVRGTQGVLTVELRWKELGRYDERVEKIQFVKRVYVSAAQVVLSFDLDVAKWLTDGRHVYCSSLAARATLSQTLVVDPLKATYAGRFAKYAWQYGFHVVAPRHAALESLVARVDVLDAEAAALSRQGTFVNLVALQLLVLERRQRPDVAELSLYSSGADDAFTDSDALRLAEAADVPTYPCVDPAALLQRVRDELSRDDWEVRDPCRRMVSASGADFLAPGPARASP
jgi:hypothetical protein